LLIGAIGFALLTAENKLVFPETPRPQLVASEDPAVIERGRYLVHGPAHCSQCHSTDDRDHPEKTKTAPLSGGLEFAMGPLATRYAANLTPHETGIKNISDADLARAIRSGVTHTGEWSVFMNLSASKPSDDDLVAIISYLRSLEPVDNAVPEGQWHAFGKILMTFAFPAVEPHSAPPPRHVPASDEPSLERGQYLTEHIALCTNCHTEFDMSQLKLTGPKGGGSLPDPSHGKDSDMEYVAPNLTSDPTGYTGKVDEDAFVGRLRGGRVFASSIMPWEAISSMTDSDLRSVYRYLKSLPPVSNDVGPTYRKRTD
jgi:mono/diheme cytochrome c family protein